MDSSLLSSTHDVMEWNRWMIRSLALQRKEELTLDQRILHCLVAEH